MSSSRYSCRAVPLSSIMGGRAASCALNDPPRYMSEQDSARVLWEDAPQERPCALRQPQAQPQAQPQPPQDSPRSSGGRMAHISPLWLALLLTLVLVEVYVLRMHK